MLLDPVRQFAKPHRTRRTGLLSLPGTLSVDLDVEYPQVKHHSLDEWLALPPEQQAPRDALAMYEVARGKVRIALIDAQTRSLHSMILGPKRGLSQFKAALEKQSSARDERPEVESGSGSGLGSGSGTKVAEIKPPGSEPQPGPKDSVIGSETEPETEPDPITRVA
jgi:hypothetical protein